MTVHQSSEEEKFVCTSQPKTLCCLIKWKNGVSDSLSISVLRSTHGEKVNNAPTDDKKTGQNIITNKKKKKNNVSVEKSKFEKSNTTQTNSTSSTE